MTAHELGLPSFELAALCCLLLLLHLLQLAVVLLSELQQGRSSKFLDYLALLPDQIDVPALWSQEELQQLRCRYFIQQVKSSTCFNMCQAG
jgi:putative effector of murein hydrolase LrgA (UPF0299 family)